MKPFPGWELHDCKIEEEEVVKELKIKVYCSCRMPQNRNKIAQCINWFHQTCENIAVSIFRKKELFTCSFFASTWYLTAVKLYSCYHISLHALQ